MQDTHKCHLLIYHYYNIALIKNVNVLDKITIFKSNYYLSYTMTNTFKSKNNLRNVQLQSCCLLQLKGFKTIFLYYKTHLLSNKHLKIGNWARTEIKISDNLIALILMALFNKSLVTHPIHC